MLPGKTYTLGDYFEILRRRVWLLSIPPLLTLFGALIYSSTIPDRYQSEMLIAIVSQRVPNSVVESTVALTADEQLDAISVRIKSRAFLGRLIEEFKLYPEQRERLSVDSLVQVMNPNITVEPAAQRAGRAQEAAPTAFEVRFTYTDPKLAAAVTQRIGALFVSQNARDRGALAQATDQFLETQLTKARDELEAQERRLEAFRSRYGQALPTQMQTNMQGIQSSQMQIQSIVESIARDRDRKMLLERLYREAEQEPVPVEPVQRSSDPQVTTVVQAGAPVEQQLAAARANLSALERRLEAQHPDVARAKRIIAELEAKSAQEAANPSSAPAVVAFAPAELQRRERLRQMAAEIESLDRQTAFKETEEQRLRRVAADYQGRVEAVPAIESQWAVLTRDYETLQETYKELLNKSESAKLSIDLEDRQMGEQFRILDNARVPVTPVGPDRLQINSFGLLGGLLLGLLAAGLLEIKDGSYRTEMDVHEVLALPVIAVVPRVLTSQSRTQARRLRLWLAAGAAAATASIGYVFWTLQLWKSVV